MRYISTRGGVPPVDFTEAMVTGLAPDGGLFVPETIPMLPVDWVDWDYETAVSRVLEMYGAADTEHLVKEAAAQFHHADVAPVVEVGDRLVLELFHGPTLSFKDHAMQVVARLLSREVGEGLILCATSGDTGSAAVEAFRGIDGLKVVILYPDGGVSDFQRRQMTTVPDGNVQAVAVRGTFDDCQRMVKEAFAHDPRLLAVNSINWARVAAQAGFHVCAAARIGEPFDVVIPSGNFGNVYSCWLAKQMGASIETITIANNANHGLSDLVNTGVMPETRVVPTRAPAMDIQVPSNLERFTADPAQEFRASWSDDRQIGETIGLVATRHNYRIDPHTATAWRAGDEARTERPLQVVATAHPSKFDDSIPPPDWYPSLAGLEERVVTIDPETSDLAHLLR